MIKSEIVKGFIAVVVVLFITHSCTMAFTSLINGFMDTTK